MNPSCMHNIGIGEAFSNQLYDKYPFKYLLGLSIESTFEIVLLHDILSERLPVQTL